MDQYKVSDFVSTDQFICKTPRRVPTEYGHKSQNCCFQGGSIFNDDASGLFFGSRTKFLQMQKNWSCVRLDLNSGFTTNVSVQSYTIMVPMVSSLLRSFLCGCEGKQQINPSPVFAPQNQNAPAEQAIQCIMYMTQTFMVHASLHQTEQNSDNIYLCSFAVVKHLGWVYN